MTPPRDYYDSENNEIINRLKEIRDKLDVLVLSCGTIAVALIVIIYKLS